MMKKIILMKYLMLEVKIEGKIISLSNSEGKIVLSRLEIFREKSLSLLEEKFNNNERVVVLIKEDVKGGSYS